MLDLVDQTSGVYGTSQRGGGQRGGGAKGGASLITHATIYRRYGKMQDFLCKPKGG